ncbi:MAG: hypothetical protein ACLR8R_10215 [Oscillospiraceae bacterium]
MKKSKHKYRDLKRGSKNAIRVYCNTKMAWRGRYGRKKIQDNWAIVFKDNPDFEALVQLWKTVIKPILPMACSLL